MSVDARPTSISLPAPGPDRLTTLDQKATPAAEREKLSELAAQFESMLMLEMIKQMRKSLLDEGAEGEGLGNETYSSTIDSELALHLAKAGGMGLTPMMVQAWERQCRQSDRSRRPLAATTKATRPRFRWKWPVA
jgi:Rod binding domain-containing protein